MSAGSLNEKAIPLVVLNWYLPLSVALEIFFALAGGLVLRFAIS